VAKAANSLTHHRWVLAS